VWIGRMRLSRGQGVSLTNRGKVQVFRQWQILISGVGTFIWESIVPRRIGFSCILLLSSSQCNDKISKSQAHYSV
jgi:hypothetical protein